MSVNKHITLAGSTMIEVVTGISLISLAMAFSIVVFSKTMDYSNMYVKHQAVNAINELIVQQKKEMNFIATQIDTGDIRIESSLVDFERHDSLQIVVYSARSISTGKEIYSRRLIKKAHAGH